LKSVGANVEDSQIEKLLKELEGKNISEVLETGKKTTFISSINWRIRSNIKCKTW